MILPILAGAVAIFVFGFLWYTFIFGKTWTKLMGFTPEAMTKAKEGGMAGKMVAMFALNIITASVLYYLLPNILVFTFAEFLCMTLVVWLGFTFPVLVGPVLWEGKSWKLVALNATHGIIAVAILSAIIYYLQ